MKKTDDLYKKIVRAMSRAVIVLDENLWGPLEADIKDQNFRIVKPKAGQLDEDMGDLLYHRILVTNNTKDFKENIIPWEFGIISTEKVNITNTKNVSKLISKAFIKHSLASKRNGFIVTIYEDKDSKIEIATE